MDITSQMEAFAVELRSHKLPLRVKFNPLPTGVAFLHVGLGRRSFVTAYYPKETGIGVDEVLEDEGFEMGYRHWFEEFEPAKEKFLSLLNEAIDSAPGAS